MKKTILIVFTVLNVSFAFAQLDANSVMGIPIADSVTQMNAIVPQEGSMVYNAEDDTIYIFNGSSTWVAIAGGTGIIYDIDVQLSTPTSVDGDTITETNVKEVIDAITPITSKAARVFYPPSVEIVITATATNATMSLYDMYTDQFGATIPTTHRSTTAPDAIPTYASNELYYYVTHADTDIFDIQSIDDAGLLTYDILAIPEDDNTILNIVFVVK